MSSGKVAHGQWDGWRRVLADIGAVGVSDRDRVVYEALCFHSPTFLPYQRVSVLVRVRGRFIPAGLPVKVTFSCNFP